MKERIWAIGIFICLLHVLLGSPETYAQQKAQRGVLDLSSVNFNTSGEVSLNGEWQFYWQQLAKPGESIRKMPEFISFPHLWNEYDELGSNGYATYRLKILLPSEYPTLALTIPDMYSAYELYIGSELIASNGRVGETRETYSPRWQPLTITLEKFEESDIDVTLLISNFDHSKGGIRIPIYIGKEDVLNRNREIELGYTFLLTGSLVMGALFFLGLFFFGRDEKTILYFALFCLVYSYRDVYKRQNMCFVKSPLRSLQKKQKSY